MADAVERQRGELAAHAEALRAAAAGVEEQMAPLKEQVDKLASEVGPGGVRGCLRVQVCGCVWVGGALVGTLLPAATGCKGVHG